jgi:hypothetical protein
MNKRKIDVTKSSDGKTTNTRNKFGSGYKKKSKLLNTFTVIEPGETTSEDISSHNDGFDPIKLVEGIENTILKWLRSEELPNENPVKVPTKDGQHFVRPLYDVLKDDHSDVIGVTQARACLFEIYCCKDDLRKSNYKLGMAHALKLVTAFRNFTYAVLEPTLELGKSRQDSLIRENTKLTNEQYEKCFEYFESLVTTEKGNRPLTKQEKWEKTQSFVKGCFQVTISTQSLRKAYTTSTK